MTQAGGHPYALKVAIDFNTRTITKDIFGFPVDLVWPAEPTKDVFVDTPPGLVGNPTVVEHCTGEQLSTIPASGSGATQCPAESQVGAVSLRVGSPFGGGVQTIEPQPVYSLVAPPGVPAQFGFNYIGVIVTLDAAVRSNGDYGLSVNTRNTSEGLALLGSDVTFWGTPADSSHESERWCPGSPSPGCSSLSKPRPFLTMPTACTPPGQGLKWVAHLDSWTHPGTFVTASFYTHAAPFYPDAGWPGPQVGITGCDKVPFDASFTGTPANLASPGPSGFDFDLKIPQTDDPITGLAPSQLKKLTVTLPEGVRVSPSSADGLQGCSSAQIGLDNLNDPSCPDGSKIGSVTIDTPLLDEPLKGSVYLATPSDNPSHSLIAIYIVAKGPGVIVKLPGATSPDPDTGRITATFDNLPQLPFGEARISFNEGPRAPLSNPSRCGTYTTHAVLESWSGKTVTSDSSFTTTHDGKGKPCPPAQFSPDFSAGTINPVAAAKSPLSVRLQRSDDDHEFNKIDFTLPPGFTASLRGVPYCPDATLTTAAGRSGVQEQAASSCPAASQVGTTQVGAGVGPSPFYVPGKAYLAGPYKGAPLSIAVVVPAVAGPFDLGTVVVRNAVHVDPTDAQLRVISDPLPTILEGIPLQVRDIAVKVDRPDFSQNPTNCSEMQATGQIGGLPSLLDGGSPLSALVSQRFQVGECASLGFKPKLHLRLFGETKRTGHPRLRAVLEARKGDANIGRVSVALPRSEFLEQAHIRTVCTRAQFASDSCPKGSIYGYAKAITPLLDEPLQGPVYLKSSDNLLPDLVASLDGQVHLDLTGRIDEVNGGIRNTFNVVPDAPVTKFILTMQGGKKGLLVNSRDICERTYRASVKMDAHNGRIHDFKPVLRADCGKGGKHKRGGGHR